MKKTHTYLSRLVFALALPVAAQAGTVYVDSLGTGDGSSPESALPTIRAGLALAGANDTVWVRGGTDRSYFVNGDADALTISGAQFGLSIRGYAETPGDDGLASILISDNYVVDGASATFSPTRPTTPRFRVSRSRSDRNPSRGRITRPVG